MVKHVLLLEGRTVSGEPEMPLGMTSPLVKEVGNLLFSWLTIGEAEAVAIAPLQACEKCKNDMRRGYMFDGISIEREKNCKP